MSSRQEEKERRKREREEREAAEKASHARRKRMQVVFGGGLVVAAVVAAVALVLDEPGFGWLLVALALALVAVATGLSRRARSTEAGTRAVPPASMPTAVVPPAAMPAGAAQAGAVPPAAVVPAQAAPAASETLAPAPATGAGTQDIPTAPAAPAADRDGDRFRFSVRRHGERVFWAVLALALVAMGTFRAAGWLFFWCVVFAIGCAMMAMAGGRTLRGLFFTPVISIAAPLRSPVWVLRGLRSPRNGGPRVVITAAVSVALLLIFGGLFAGADAEFRHMLGSILPPLKGSEIARAIFCFVVVLLVACGVAFLAAARPRLAEVPPIAPRRVGRFEWALPLAVLNVLFAVFVVIQVTVLFGHDRQLMNASHAYMRGYAHNGFWQLLVVSLLTMTVLMVTSRIAPQEKNADRVLVRVLLGGLTVFSIVIVLAALKRMYSYEESYGYTRLRVAVAGIECWLGVVFVLILVAGITLRAGWLTRTVVASLALALLAGAIANPDRYVAQHNVDRYHRTGKLSVEYMRQLSPDAVPAIMQLPAHLRDCSLKPIAKRVLSRGDDWRTWNTSRVDARDQLWSYDPATVHKCTARVQPTPITR